MDEKRVRGTDVRKRKVLKTKKKEKSWERFLLEEVANFTNVSLTSSSADQPSGIQPARSFNGSRGVKVVPAIPKLAN